MTQLSPTNLIYSQALEIISNLRKDYAASKYKNPEDVIEIINKALTDFENRSGKTLTQYEPVVHSEVPDSDKMNRLWSNLQTDVNILQDQVDTLRAAAIFTHNFMKTEINKSKNQTKRLMSKLKTLELYADTDDDTLVYFGDTFISDDFIDNTFAPNDNRVTFLGQGKIGLGVRDITTAIDNSTNVEILSGSNGFIGNNQEVIDPTNAPVDPYSGDPVYTFSSATYNPSNTDAIIDNQPASWFEFEKYYVRPDLRSLAKNYNFHYNLNGLADDHYLFDSEQTINSSKGLINWADGIKGRNQGTLSLKLQIDLGAAKLVNHIRFTPFGLTNNRNNPIRVRRVYYSADGSNWSIANPENVWIANSIDRRLSTIDAEIISLDEAIWILEETANVRFIRFEIEQPNPVVSDVGHLFYIDKQHENTHQENSVFVPYKVTADDLIYDDDVYYDHPLYDPFLQGELNETNINYTASSSIDSNEFIGGNLEYRKLGPNPSALHPTEFIGMTSFDNGNLFQKTEYFPGLRWAIGIRDIELNQVIYQDSSYFISNKFHFSGIIDRVALEAEIEIPDSFNPLINWIKFYITPDDGLTWHAISRIQDDFLAIPEIIAFNDPTPIDLREPGVSYIETLNSVDSLRLKAEFTRPDNAQYLTPMLKSYRLKIKKRI